MTRLSVVVVGGSLSGLAAAVALGPFSALWRGKVLVIEPLPGF